MRILMIFTKRIWGVDTCRSTVRVWNTDFGSFEKKWSTFVLSMANARHFWSGFGRLFCTFLKKVETSYSGRLRAPAVHGVSSKANSEYRPHAASKIRSEKMIVKDTASFGGGNLALALKRYCFCFKFCLRVSLSLRVQNLSSLENNYYR